MAQQDVNRHARLCPAPRHFLPPTHTLTPHATRSLMSRHPLASSGAAGCMRSSSCTTAYLLPCFSLPPKQPRSPSQPSPVFPALHGTPTFTDILRRNQPLTPRRGLGGRRCGSSTSAAAALMSAGRMFSSSAAADTTGCPLRGPRPNQRAGRAGKVRDSEGGEGEEWPHHGIGGGACQWLSAGLSHLYK